MPKFVCFNTELVPNPLVTEVPRQVKAVRVQVLRAIVLGVVKAVPSLPREAIG